MASTIPLFDINAHAHNKPDINTLLAYSVERILALPRLRKLKYWLKQNTSASFGWHSIENNISHKRYTDANQFMDDIKRIKEKYCNKISYVTQQANDLESCFKIEVELIQSCAECYLEEVQDKTDRWFLESCSKPHLLLMVKFVQCPYWPAKLISVAEGKVFVRFFGDLQVNAVEKHQCFLYPRPRKQSCRKVKSQKLLRSIADANHYIKNLTANFGAFNYAKYRTPININNIEQHLIDMVGVEVGTSIEVISETRAIENQVNSSIIEITNVGLNNSTSENEQMSHEHTSLATFSISTSTPRSTQSQTMSLNTYALESVVPPTLRTREQLVSERDELRNKLKNHKDRYEARLEQLKRTHENILKNTKNDYAKMLKKQKDRHKDEIAQLKTRAEEMKNAYEKKLQESKKTLWCSSLFERSENELLLEYVLLWRSMSTDALESTYECVHATLNLTIYLPTILPTFMKSALK